jgi:hypothetical protein
MKFKKDNSRKFNLRYQCQNHNCCRKISILAGTPFEHCKDLKQAVYSIACFCIKKKIADVFKENKIEYKIISKYYKICRLSACKIMDNEELKLGGEGMEIEIDESHLFTRKYHRGHFLRSESISIFSIFKRDTKRV